jgi:undecaprenyl-phosphate galactose phosphotransferase
MAYSKNIQDVGIFDKNTIMGTCRLPNWSIYYSLFKRLFDIMIVLISLPIVLPLLGVLILLIKLDSKGPAIFKSTRIGKNRKAFNIYKLRTMCQDADKELEILFQKDPHLKEEWEKYQKLRKDPRITRIGRFLRVLSLDELPQVFNVLKGEMSWVGPRPIVEQEIIRYGNKFSFYEKLRPGITGLWQVNGRNNTSYDSRIELDVKYACQCNFNMDLAILFKTVPATLSKNGAY